MNYSYIKKTLKNYKPSEYYNPGYFLQPTNADMKSSLNSLENQYQPLTRYSASEPFLGPSVREGAKAASIENFEVKQQRMNALNSTNTLSNNSSSIPIVTQFEASQSNGHVNELDVDDTKHSSYINHVLNCEHCKKLFSKQYNLETQRIFNEDFMDIVTYVLFGILVYFLLSLL